MSASWTVWLMRAFIGSVVVLSLFGPYAISILLGLLGLGVYFYGDDARSRT